MKISINSETRIRNSSSTSANRKKPSEDWHPIKNSFILSGTNCRIAYWIRVKLQTNYNNFKKLIENMKKESKILNYSSKIEAMPSPKIASEIGKKSMS